MNIIETIAQKLARRQCIIKKQTKTVDDAKRYFKHHTPPSSMTPAERDYYAIHKTLAGFYANQ